MQSYYYVQLQTILLLRAIMYCYLQARGHGFFKSFFFLFYPFYPQKRVLKDQCQSVPPPSFRKLPTAQHEKSWMLQQLIFHKGLAYIPCSESILKLKCVTSVTNKQNQALCLGCPTYHHLYLWLCW